MTDRFEDRLSEYLDGTLAPTDAGRVEAHLTGCDECARTLEELRAVVARAAGLPRHAPARDLWPEIEARIGETGDEEGATGAGAAPPAEIDTSGPDAPVVPAHRRRVAVSVPQLAAAALLLVSLSAGAAWMAARGAGAGADLATGPADAAPDAAFVADDPTGANAAERYATAIRDLEAALFDAESPLPEETAAKIRRSLAVIDRAIADARRALEEAPSDRYVRQHLAATMRRKVDFLRGTVRLVMQS